MQMETDQALNATKNEAALALLCAVGKVTRLRGLSRNAKADLKNLAVVAVAALKTGQVPSELQPKKTEHEAVLVLILSALEASGMAWSDIASIVNRYAVERR